MTATNILLVFAAATSALMAGLFFAWSCSVMPGFARLTDKDFVSAMQKTNRAIQNPVFFTAFFGAPISLIASTAFHYDQSPRSLFLFAATLVYLIGTFAVTIFGNVPLNRALDRFDLEIVTAEELVLQRANFERRWNNLNHVRAISATLAVILITLACLN